MLTYLKIGFAGLAAETLGVRTQGSKTLSTLMTVCPGRHVSGNNKWRNADEVQGTILEHLKNDLGNSNVDVATTWIYMYLQEMYNGSEGNPDRIPQESAIKEAFDQFVVYSDMVASYVFAKLPESDLLRKDDHLENRRVFALKFFAFLQRGMEMDCRLLRTFVLFTHIQLLPDQKQFQRNVLYAFRACWDWDYEKNILFECQELSDSLNKLQKELGKILGKDYWFSAEKRKKVALKKWSEKFQDVKKPVFAVNRVPMQDQKTPLGLAAEALGVRTQDPQTLSTLMTDWAGRHVLGNNKWRNADEVQGTIRKHLNKLGKSNVDVATTWIYMYLQGMYNWTEHPERITQDSAIKEAFDQFVVYREMVASYVFAKLPESDLLRKDLGKRRVFALKFFKFLQDCHLLGKFVLFTHIQLLPHQHQFQLIVLYAFRACWDYEKNILFECQELSDSLNKLQKQLTTMLGTKTNYEYDEQKRKADDMWFAMDKWYKSVNNSVFPEPVSVDKARAAMLYTLWFQTVWFK